MAKKPFSQFPRTSTLPDNSVIPFDNLVAGQTQGILGSDFKNQVRMATDINSATLEVGGSAFSRTINLTTAQVTGIQLGASSYQKPALGIPATDLTAAVQSTLQSVDSKYVKPADGIPITDLDQNVRDNIHLTWIADYDATTSYEQNVTFTYQGVLYRTLVGHTAEEFDPAHNTALAGITPPETEWSKVVSIQWDSAGTSVLTLRGNTITTVVVKNTLEATLNGTYNTTDDITTYSVDNTQQSFIVYDINISDTKPVAVLYRPQTLSVTIPGSLLGWVSVFADLPATQTAINSLFGRNAIVHDYINVDTDETHDDNTYQYYIVSIDTSGNINYGLEGDPQYHPRPIEVNADWNATTGKAYIKNKPVVPSFMPTATETISTDDEALAFNNKYAGKSINGTITVNITAQILQPIQINAVGASQADTPVFIFDGGNNTVTSIIVNNVPVSLTNFARINSLRVNDTVVAVSGAANQIDNLYANGDGAVVFSGAVSGPVTITAASTGQVTISADVPQGTTFNAGGGVIHDKRATGNSTYAVNGSTIVSGATDVDTLTLTLKSGSTITIPLANAGYLNKSASDSNGSTSASNSGGFNFEDLNTQTSTRAALKTGHDTTPSRIGLFLEHLTNVNDRVHLVAMNNGTTKRLYLLKDTATPTSPTDIQAGWEVLNKSEIQTLISQAIGGSSTGGLPIPEVIDLESHLPDITSGASQTYNYLVENMDVTSPGRQGQAWAAQGTTTWTTFVDMVQALSTDFFQQNASGEWEIKSDIQEVIDGAVQGSQIVTSEPTAESTNTQIVSAARIYTMFGAALSTLTTTAKTVVAAINELVSNLTAHTGNSDIHVTTSDKSNWNSKQAALSRSVQINLASTSAVSDTGGNITPGVTGILAQANGGTGYSSLAAALSALPVVS